MSFPSMNKMPIIEHRIDPEPDTVIKLYNPCVDFAPWEVPVPPHTAATAEERGLSATPSTTRTRKKTAITEKKKLAKGKRSSQIASDANVTANVGASLFGGDSSDVPTESSSAANVEASIDDKQEREASVLYYVSSRHLILASTWFRRALVTEKWAESKRNEKDGLIHIEADDWDSNAFLIFLNIIHLQNRKVPREISMDDLAKIAVFVDYYECAEAVEPFTNMWKEHLTTADPVPATYCRNLTLWICSAWVFEWKDQFNEATLVAFRQCSEPMRALGLPIPQRVSDEIDLKRYQAMENVIENLHDLRRKYESLDYVCPQNSTYSFNCGSMLYGVGTLILAINSQ
ncbi:hypothetical protein SLS60_000515 [Paraconiothyrium brasiliense]|uniref:BTB domain-containing protein n=1 Tax=Paraconiothyrium brasiliense TaxID=300254 RepID=A0ABR3S6I3_9PLEO